VPVRVRKEKSVAAGADVEAIPRKEPTLRI
jgi:hypothetical protein